MAKKKKSNNNQSSQKQAQAPRKQQTQAAAKQQKKSNLPLIIIAAALCIVAVCVFAFGRGGGNQSDKDTSNTNIAEGEYLTIQTADVGSKASFYPITVDGTEMEVIAVRASDGTVRTAFNTCQSCYTSGAGYYVQEGDDLVCQNCGYHFTPDQVEIQAGGCNPWPIFPENKTVTDDEIQISYAFLKDSVSIFENWKV